MSLKFNEAFAKVLEKVTSLDDGLKVDEEICEKIYQAFHDVNSIFKGTLFDLNKTNTLKSYYQPWIVLKMPFKITPNKLCTVSKGGIYQLKAGRNVRHLAVQNGLVDPKLLAALFDFDLKRAVGRIGQVRSGQSGQVYKLDAESESNSEIVLYSIDVTWSPIAGGPELFYYFELGLQFLDDPNVYKPFGTVFLVLEKPINIIGKDDIVACDKFMKHLNIERSEDTDNCYFPDKFRNRPLSDGILDTLKYVVSVSNPNVCPPFTTS
ncbi:uncharacterized protein LOC111072688 [Drosophila obscura]|uniref:uncharacterized protein LOC111072688 n=1 Tax=Drosophila obscura TaxID=7282 RepID=UPI001BB1133A|nr:uncharacterized protein LOC111072688 [Drosophila obscura]